MKKIIPVLITAGLFVSACSMDDSSELLAPGDTSGTGGSTASFTIVGDYLYTVDNSSLKITDISTTENPEFLKQTNLNFGIETVFPRDDKLFIGSMTGMYIFDLQDPENPEKLSYFEHIYSCDPVVADEDYAYITLNSTFGNCGRWNNELQIVDISNLRKPHLVYNKEMFSPRGLNILNDTLIICDNGLKIFKVAQDRKNVELLHHFDIAATDLIRLNQNLLIIGNDGLYQYQLNDDEIKLLSSILIDPK